MSAVSDRTFGAEIEFFTYKYPEDVGRELVRAFPKVPSSAWMPYDDGSAVEIHTPVLRGEEGFELLEGIFDVLKKRCDGRVTSEDGFHVHFGTEDMRANPDILARIVRSWMNVEDVLNLFIAPYRRGNYWACADLTSWGKISDMPKEIRKMKKEGYAEKVGDPYGILPGRRKLNIDHVAGAVAWGEDYQNTIEVRSHEGTLNFKEAAAWIKMLQAFFDYHQYRPSLPRLRRPETLLQRLNVDDDVGSTLLAKAEKMPTFEMDDHCYDDEMDEPIGYGSGCDCGYCP